MEKIEKKGGCKQQQEENTTDLFLRWGNKKRLRCVRVRDPDDAGDPSYGVSGRRRIRRKINSRFVAFPSGADAKEPSIPRLTRNSDTQATLKSESSRKSSPEVDRLYPTRGSAAVDGGGAVVGGGVDENSSKSKHVWPKLCITLSTKEKEEDFMAMKGCKPPHRPKKRAKIIQRTLLLVSPGAWLSDMCQDRYEVREKKTTNTKKRPAGLKAMGNMESDSE